ncbi:hypothetical protein ABBQ32_013834 [Trebouxia sp. C0010 RCD-2024]
MADVTAPAAPFAKARLPLLTLDEVPHKRHVRPPVFSACNPLVPEPGTPAFASRQDQFAADTAAVLKRAEEARRQQKKASLNDRRQHHRAAEYKGEHEEDRKFKRERERVLNLQATDAGRANRSGDHFDIVTLAYQPSQGGRQLKSLDETVKYQAALRTMDIFSKKHSVQHDIITGHPLVANYIIPPKPEPF